MESKNTPGNRSREDPHENPGPQKGKNTDFLMDIYRAKNTFYQNICNKAQKSLPRYPVIATKLTKATSMQNLGSWDTENLNSSAGNLRGGQQLNGDSPQEITKRYFQKTNGHSDMINKIHNRSVNTGQQGKLDHRQ
jgi:hypothetical protein